MWATPAVAAPGALPGPAPEVGTGAKVSPPAVPSFEVVGSEPGFHSVPELVFLGKPLLGTEVKVKGYITWIYDCAKATGRTQQQLDADPTVCARPRFYLGSRRGAPVEESMWVVDVPRLPTKLERERLPKAELAKWPAVPKLAVGDYVAVTATFDLRSPHGDANTDGLLVYRAVDHLAVPTTQPAALPSPVPPPIELAKLPPAPRMKIADGPRNASVKRMNAAVAALDNRQTAEAVQALTEAVKVWPGNHAAWYALGGAYTAMTPPDWAKAADAFEHATAAAPSQGMYWLFRGVASYELARTATPLDFTAARTAFTEALALDAKLWRAHYYLGRIYRDTGFPKTAAEELTAAIAAAPKDAGPWVALAELYRRWQYFDASLAVAQQGAAIVAKPRASDLWYLAGQATEAAKLDAKAVEAYTQALDARADNLKARYARGVVYARTGERVKAKADLEAFVKAAGPDLQFAKQQATKLLADLAAKK